MLTIEIPVPQQYELMQVVSVLRSMGGTYGQLLADKVEAAALAPPPPEPPAEPPA
jgi:hypothetical protein